MSSYDSMVNAMSAVGAYSLNGTTYVDNELKSYAAELDVVSQEIDEIIGECLVMTAEGDGLRFYEKLVGAPRDDLDVDTRRERIISLLNLNTNDNTSEGIRRFFLSLGMECEIEEYPAVFDLYIKPVGEDYSYSERKYILKRAKDFLPCHLTFTIDFRKSTWIDYDVKGRTFAQIDALNLTWEDFELKDL